MDRGLVRRLQVWDNFYQFRQNLAAAALPLPEITRR
jgi:hypothetical protein